jgi:ubiquitin C-terminal hydrolase
MIMRANDENFFVDWSKAPKKTTHVCVLGFLEFEDGVPVHTRNWEKWVPIFKKGKHTGDHRIHEWDASTNSWVFYTDSLNGDIFPKTRIIKPSLVNSMKDKHGHWDRS